MEVVGYSLLAFITALVVFAPMMAALWDLGRQPDSAFVAAGLSKPLLALMVVLLNVLGAILWFVVVRSLVIRHVEGQQRPSGA